MADITANATCGAEEAEMHCKLVDHVPGQPVRNPQCSICNLTSSNPNGNWILERSIDGVTFEPWQYYAITDTECLTRFSILPRTGPPSYTRDDEVICTSFYSKIHPLENGEIHTSLINGRPSADDPSPTLLNFTSARYIRLVLQRIRTLNADLMTLTFHDPKEIDPIVTRRYYYSIKDISVGGMCICYGHAKACPLDAQTKKFSCECEHNTCGESCDRCCPGYNQQPWMAGTYITRHVCEKCNCHGKAEECYFNQTVADLSLSLDTHGQYRGGGVCVGCRDNTDGINCQSCKRGYYRPQEVDPEQDDPCIPCSCDPDGSLNQWCVPDETQASIGRPAGSCRCKEGFGGLRCDRCAVGYKDYPLCRRCNCSLEGSTNEDPCVSPCVCKENVEGPNCDRCKLGFYNLQRDNRRGCDKCSCMGVSSQCSASAWVYHNLSAYGGNVVYTVSYTVDQQVQISIRVTSEPDLIIEGGGMRITVGRFGQPVYPSSPVTREVALLPEHFVLSDTAQPISRRDFLSVLANVTKVMVRATYSTDPTAVYRLHLFSVEVANPSARGERTAAAVEMCSCPPGFSGTSCESCSRGYRRVNALLYNGFCEECECHGHSSHCDAFTGHCLNCLDDTTGPFCDTCSPGYYGNATRAHLPTASHAPAPCTCPATTCQCHTNGSVSEVCNQETGQCQCRDNVMGRQCDECLPNCWWDPDTEECVACQCSPHGSVSQRCDVEGRCICRPGYVGRRCDLKRQGYERRETRRPVERVPVDAAQQRWPSLTRTGGCPRGAYKPSEGECGCNALGSVTQQCNVNTGCCMCRDNYRGEKCNECQIGYRDFPQCIQCQCNAAGSDRETCDLERGVCGCADRTGKCSCKANVIGDHCDQCKVDTFGLSVHNPLGCSKCYCYGLTHSCTEAPGLIRMWLTLRQEQTVLPLVDKSNTLETRTGVSFQHPEILAHSDLVSSALSEPYYWKLPEQFRGSMITAYGGQLKYAVYYEARDETGPSSYEPQVIIKGGPNHNMIMMRHTPGLQIGQLTRHHIDMTEECAAGFYRLRSGSSAPAPASRVPTAAGMGSCVQCQCSGHSSTCDPDTSICQDCQDNTEGDRCERCAPGFYGVVRGFADDCKPCACPLLNPQNNFSPTCVAEGFDDYRCTACPEGYEGKHCERCATGYHGNPRQPGGLCEECKCSEWGSVPGPCDPVTGQCRCRGGSSGRACDQCMDRHVCGPAGIISCDDECSGLLISDMDRLYRIITEVTLSSPLPPPYKMLYRFENMTEELKHMLSPQKAPERLLALADSNLGSLVIEIDQLHSRATKVSADGEQVEDDSDRIHKRAQELEQFVRDTLLGANELQLKALELNKTLSRKDGTPDKSLSQMKEEIGAMLAEMRARELGGKRGIADQELELAEELYQRVKKMFGDPHQATEDLKAEIKEKLSDHEGKLQEAQELLNEAQGKTRQAGTLAQQNHANLTALERKRDAVSAVQQMTQDVLGEGENLLVEANNLSDDINKGLEELEEMQAELGPVHQELQDKVSGLTEGLGGGRLASHVTEAEDYAKQLNESAAILDGILAEARNLSFNATAAFKAYSNIKANVDAAEKEAKAAKQRASEALTLALGPDVPMKEEADGAVKKSHDLLNQAKQLQKDVQGNADNVALLKGRVKAAKDKTKDLVKGIDVSMATLHAIPNDTAARVAATKAVAADANATAIDVLERLGNLNLQIQGLQKNYGELEDTVNAANQMIQDPEKNTIIYAAGAKVKDLEDEADRLLEKLQPIKMLQDNLRRNISQIKELISQARKQANSIKVSVSSGGDCLRSYRPEIRKGRYNTIILHVKTTTPDNLLFYLGSAQYVDFLALEMRKGKVNFLWDVGSGVGRVEYPQLTIHDGNWHRIEASRKGLTGTIAVYPLEGSNAGMMPTPASADSPTSFTILDVDQNAYLFVGGIFGTIKKADAVRSSTFVGCMGETFLDGKPIGLWNYRERQGDCKGCVVSPQKSDGEGTVQLDGEGYAAVARPTRWKPDTSTVTFKFRTFTSEALLMYLATQDMKDFMSLELSEGKVKVNFDLGSGVGSAISIQRHNDGHWKSLTMSRNKKQATVNVVDIESGAEERIVAVSPGSATGLNLRENQRIYFGGLPTIGNYRSEVTLKRYAGCLREIEVSRTPYDLLSSSDYTGVTKDVTWRTCTLTLNDTGTVLLAVGGSAPVTLQARNLNFYNNKRKRRQSGEPYLSVMLNQGSLEVLLFSGSHTPRRVIRRPEQGILHDGREHSLRIERLAGRTFAVQVDEEPKKEVGLPNDQPMVFQRVFLGGIPAEVEQTSNRVNVPFKGCIWNLMINTVLSDFSQPVSFVNADIGRCPSLAPAPPPLPLPEPTATSAPVTTAPGPAKTTPSAVPVAPTPAAPTEPDAETDACASAVAPTALEQAYQFGLSRNSHMSFNFDDTKVRER
ncbi:hypothetical protein WMY93_015816 [Mugilogobius chulae]|uniref:Laminin subunit alpha-2 n=1 Tax=Mugilogobius chulae TaxID=88201 RepID=A0AAW0NR81_9GOBI